MDIRLTRIICLAVCIIWAARLLAQAGPEASGTDDQRISLRIAGLTSEERDALTRELDGVPGARIAFACVPAGLIVLESTESGRNADTLRLRAMPGLLRNVAPSRISEDHISLRSAEELCAEARNR